MIHEDMTGARVLADSLNSARGDRLTTMEVTFPRFILAEFNTHRVFSRNSASSRAIPIDRQIQSVRDNPFVPQTFPINRPGMSAIEYLTPDDGDGLYWAAVAKWLYARDIACSQARSLARIKVHKQIVNRLIEPFMWHTVIVSSTTWTNFFDLRISEFAQPEMRVTAEAMKVALEHSTPREVSPHLDEKDRWHLPLIYEGESQLSLGQKIQISAARCAAVSYNRHLEVDYDKEFARYQLLSQNGHLSPLEHQARAVSYSLTGGNFRGWVSHRYHVEQGFELTGWNV